MGEAGVNGGVVVNLGVDSPSYAARIGGVDRYLIKVIRQNPAGYYVPIDTTAVPWGETRAS